MPVKQEHTKEIRVCRQCGNRLGQRHRWWCGYAPEPPSKAYIHTDKDGDYIIIS